MSTPKPYETDSFHPSSFPYLGLKGLPANRVIRNPEWSNGSKEREFVTIQWRIRCCSKLPERTKMKMA